MKKLIGRLLAIVLIAALAVCGIVTYNGYQLYKEAVAAVPVSEKVVAIEAQTHYTTYDALPKRYIEAVIAAEDRRFFRHHGFDILATGRAMWHNIEAGRLIEGGSTITQQLAKNMYFSQEKKFTSWKISATKRPCSSCMSIRFTSGQATTISMMPRMGIMIKNQAT